MRLLRVHTVCYGRLTHKVIVVLAEKCGRGSGYLTYNMMSFSLDILDLGLLDNLYFKCLLRTLNVKRQINCLVLMIFGRINCFGYISYNN